MLGPFKSIFGVLIFAPDIFPLRLKSGEFILGLFILILGFIVVPGILPLSE